MARPDGGFWLAHEGKTGPENVLVKLDATGAVTNEIPLPAEITSQLGSNGLEGIAVTGTGAAEQVWFALQRPLTTDATDVVLPLLEADEGWTQDKVEGLTVGGDGSVYAVTDNDGLDKATGPAVFGGNLPITGSTIVRYVAAGVGLVILGVAVFVLARRRRVA